MYNCEQQIIRVLNQLDEKVKKFITEVLIVNNRSTDNGEMVVKEYLKNIIDLKVCLWKNNANYGLGGSHKVAFYYALKNGFDYIIVLHGDDQGNIQDIIPLLEQNEYGKYDCLLGARFQKGSHLQGYSYFRTFGNCVYNILFSIASGYRIYDLGSGLNCYKVEILRNNFFNKFFDNLTFNYCMILASVYYKHKIKFFPITWKEDDQISNVKLFRQAIQVLNLLISFVKNKKKFLNSEHRNEVIQEYGGVIIDKNL